LAECRAPRAAWINKKGPEGPTLIPLSVARNAGRLLDNNNSSTEEKREPYLIVSYQVFPNYEPQPLHYPEPTVIVSPHHRMITAAALMALVASDGVYAQEAVASPPDTTVSLVELQARPVAQPLHLGVQERSRSRAARNGFLIGAVVGGVVGLAITNDFMDEPLLNFAMGAAAGGMVGAVVGVLVGAAPMAKFRKGFEETARHPGFPPSDPGARFPNRFLLESRCATRPSVWH
jgi:hypothetical protein